jgi:tRNA (guanine9-N1)-methyltransferase
LKGETFTEGRNGLGTSDAVRSEVGSFNGADRGPNAGSSSGKIGPASSLGLALEEEQILLRQFKSITIPIFLESTQSVQSLKMESDERPQKMRKLSHDHEVSQTEGDALKNDANAVNENDVVQPTAGDETVSQKNENAETKPVTVPTDAVRADGSLTTNAQDPPMSKNQLKKLRKKQEWEAGREERKVIRKEKVVAKRERKRAAKEQAEEEGGEKPLTGAEKRMRHIQRPVQLNVTIVLDCDFDNLMRDNERVSLGSQITRCYSDNKNSKYRAHLTVSSFGGHLRERFDGLLNGVYKQWKGMRFMDEDFVETAEKAKEWMNDTRGKPFKGAFAKYADLEPAKIEELKQQGEIVYLSSEADDTLEELKPFSTYIIGGLVDKNREKGICHKRATQRGIRTAKLPIGKYLDMASRKVLATNHVNEIMVHWLECGDWGEAFMKVMPKRKGGKLRDESDKNEGGEDPADAEEDVAEVDADDEQALEEQANNAAEVEEGVKETPDVTMAAAS